MVLDQSNYFKYKSISIIYIYAIYVLKRIGFPHLFSYKPHVSTIKLHSVSGELYINSITSMGEFAQRWSVPWFHKCWCSQFVLVGFINYIRAIYLQGLFESLQLFAITQLILSHTHTRYTVYVCWCTIWFKLYMGVKEKTYNFNEAQFKLNQWIANWRTSSQQSCIGIRTLLFD